MIHTDVGCCCSLPDVVSSVVFFGCFLFLSAGIEANCLFFFFLFFFFFFSPLSHYPPFSFSLSLSPPSLLTFPAAFFFFFLLLSLSCFLCPLVLSIIVWLNKRVYKIKLINKKKKKKKAVNDDSIVTHTHCYVLSVLLTGQKKKKKETPC